MCGDMAIDLALLILDCKPHCITAPLRAARKKIIDLRIIGCGLDVLYVSAVKHAGSPTINGTSEGNKYELQMDPSCCSYKRE
ncbi:hypothetical protein D3C80_1506150 [compost metagenome]